MSSRSQDSAFDIDTFRARTQNVIRDSSPAPHARRRTETDFAAVGALFDRRASEPRPRSLDLSEGEETARNSQQLAFRAELLSNADAVVAGGRIPSRSPSTPTPTRRHLTSYIQPSDMIQVRRDRMRSRRRRHHRGTFLIRYVTSRRLRPAAVRGRGHGATREAASRHVGLIFLCSPWVTGSISSFVPVRSRWLSHSRPSVRFPRTSS